MNGNLISSSTYGQRVYALREKAGYNTPRELALVLCGYSKKEKGLIDDEAKRVDRMRRNIQNWEQGKNIPSAQMIATLCNLLDCDPDHLLYEDVRYPRKEVKSISSATGLSTNAVETMLGMCKYGPVNALKALDTILRHEKAWYFLSRQEETISGINLLWHIGRYLSDDRAPNHYLVYINEKTGYPFNRVEISADNYINHGEPLAALYDRAIMDTINDALKQIRTESNTKLTSAD